MLSVMWRCPVLVSLTIFINHLAGDLGETCMMIVVDLHWVALLEKWSYHNPALVARDLVKRDR